MAVELDTEQLQTLKESAEKMHKILEEGYGAVETHFIDPEARITKDDIQRSWHASYDPFKSLLDYQYSLLSETPDKGYALFSTKEGDKNFYWQFKRYNVWYDPSGGEYEIQPTIEIRTPTTSLSIQGQHVEGMAQAGGYDIGMWRDILYTATSISRTRFIEASFFSYGNLRKITREDMVGLLAGKRARLDNPYRSVQTINLALL